MLGWALCDQSEVGMVSNELLNSPKVGEKNCKVQEFVLEQQAL